MHKIFGQHHETFLKKIADWIIDVLISNQVPALSISCKYFIVVTRAPGSTDLLHSLNFMIQYAHITILVKQEISKFNYIKLTDLRLEKNYKFTKLRMYVMYLTTAFLFGHSRILWSSILSMWKLTYPQYTIS